jgi:transposase
MFVAKVPNRKSRPTYLLRESYREKGQVKTRTIANITHWDPARIEAVRRAFHGDFDGILEDRSATSGQIFGVLFVLKAIADRLGLTHALGKRRFASLALFLILARVAHQGSRLSAVRWAQNHAVAEILGLRSFDEDDLYATLDELCKDQERIEDTLFRDYVKKQEAPPALVLYDVTSSYLEGTCNELAAFGYDRDHKYGKMQIVIGLLTGPDGEPLAVKVYEGQTSDVDTVHDPLETIKNRFGIEEVVFVGDRGMVKTKGKLSIKERGFKYITALTDPQIRKLLKSDVLQLSLFDETIHEVQHGRLRYVLRRNDSVRIKEQRRREDKVRKLTELILKRNEFVRGSKRCKPEAGLRSLTGWVQRHKLGSFVFLSLKEREIDCTLDEAAKTDAALLDGCYVIETDVSKTIMEGQAVHDRYKDLQQVERDFRTLKTAFLEVRPIYLRNAARTKAHVFVAMLALKIVRELRHLLVKEFGTTEQDKMALTLEDVLTHLGRLCLQIYPIKEGSSITQIPLPDETQTKILKAIGVIWPTRLNNTRVKV